MKPRLRNEIKEVIFMIEVLNVKENLVVNDETDYKKYITMIQGSEFGNYAKEERGYIFYEGTEIPTKEVIFDGENGYSAVVIFCESDESYITTEVR